MPIDSFTHLMNPLLEFLGVVRSDHNRVSRKAMAMIVLEDELLATIAADKPINWSRYDNKVNINRVYKTDRITTTLLLFSVDQQRWEIALKLLEKGADIYLKDEQGRTALHVFLNRKLTIEEWNNPHYIKLYEEILLLGNKNTLKLQAKDDYENLFRQLIEVHDQWILKPRLENRLLTHWWQIISQLLKMDIDTDIQSSSGNTPLHFYLSDWGQSISGSLEEFETILNQSNHLSINRSNKQGKTPLHLACGIRKEVVIALLEAGADPALQDIKGNTCLHLYLKSYAKNLSTEYKNNYLIILQKLLEKMDTASINRVNQEGKIALHCFLERNLMFSIDKREVKWVLSLLDEKGASFNNSDVEKNTLLHHLIKQDFYPAQLGLIIDVLRPYCDFTATNQYGFSAADILEMRGYSQFTNLLNEGKLTKTGAWKEKRQVFLKENHGEKESVINEKWGKELEKVIKEKSEKADIILCVIFGCDNMDAALKNSIVFNPTHLLIDLVKAKALASFIEILIKNKVISNLEIVDKAGNTILHVLIDTLKNHLNTVLSTQSSAKRKNSERSITNNTRFWKAFQSIQEILQLFIQYGVNPNFQNNESETALHQLAAFQNIIHNPYLARCQSVMAAILRDNGTQLELQNNQGKTALQLAESVQQSSKDIDIIDTLQGKNYMDRLPTEILRKIIQEFTLQDVKLVSSRFYGISNDWHSWLNYHVVAAYAKPLKEYCHRMFEGLKEKNKTIQEANKEVLTHLRKIIREMPYIIKMEYLQKYFPDNYQYLKNQVEAKKSREDKKKYLCERFKREIKIDNGLILSDPSYRKLLFENLNFWKIDRTSFLYVLNNDKLWGFFIKILEKSESDEEITLFQIITEFVNHFFAHKIEIIWNANHIVSGILDEEIILCLLQHKDFHKILLEENESGGKWLKYIFEFSIDSDFKVYHNYYQVFGSDRLASALFIINHKDYSECLVNALLAVEVENEDSEDEVLVDNSISACRNKLRAIIQHPQESEGLQKRAKEILQKLDSLISEKQAETQLSLGLR